MSPIPFDSSAPKAVADDRATEGGPSLGDTEVQRPVTGLGEQLVCPHHDHRVVVLDRDLEVVEVVLLEEPGLPHSRLDEGLGRGLAVLVEDALVEAAGVDADADRGAVVLGRLGDLLDTVVRLADVARVDAHGRAAGLDGPEDVLGLEVDVGDDRDLAVLGDLGERVGVVWLGQATRTMSQPAAVSSAICCSVVLTSEVSVVVIDCTEIGDSLPTPTEPTLIWRVGRRGARTGAGALGMPRETLMPSIMRPSGWTLAGTRLR